MASLSWLQPQTTRTTLTEQGLSVTMHGDSESKPLQTRQAALHKFHVWLRCFCLLLWLVVLLFWFLFLFGFLVEWNHIALHHESRELATVSASLAVISTASKHLHNDLARAIEALEQKKTDDLHSFTRSFYKFVPAGNELSKLLLEKAARESECRPLNKYPAVVAVTMRFNRLCRGSRLPIHWYR